MRKYKLLFIIVSAVLALVTLPISACSQVTYPTVPGEVEATEFQGVKLTPIKDQLNNALKGTQIINKDTYTLTIDGLVDHPLTLSYADLQAYPQISQLMDINLPRPYGRGFHCLNFVALHLEGKRKMQGELHPSTLRSGILVR